LRATLLGYSIKNVLEQFPWTVIIRIRQRRSLRCFHTELLQPPFATGESANDFSQGLCIGQLAKQHRDKMVPACETTRMPFRPGLLHGLMKFVS
jgi:hypothetical protein